MSEEEWSTPEVVRSLQRLEADVHEIKGDVKAQSATYATKDDLAQLKDSHGREIGELRASIVRVNTRLDTQQAADVTAERAKTPAWPLVLSSMTSVIATVIALIAFLATH